jgi:hypothetical protein
MERLEQNEQLELARLNRIADELDDLQKKENDGRGVGCVRDVVLFLRDGQLSEARKICIWDSDKIRNYPNLVQYIKNNLFDEDEEHPWSVLERLQQQKTPYND